MAYIKRLVTPAVLQALETSPVVFVNGPRQAGKSTLVQELAKHSWPAEYVTFDNASQAAAAATAPESFLRAYDGPVIFDEVQIVPELYRPLKLMVDELRKTRRGKVNGRFLLTGSANMMALPQLADALVGRMSVISLYPLSATEAFDSNRNFIATLFDNAFRAGRIKSKTGVLEAMSRATFPEITEASEEIRSTWFESYLTTILQRDLRQVADIERAAVLPALLRVLATRAGGLVNEADIARSVGLNAVTGKRYRTILQMMFLSFDIQPWYRNIGKRIVKSSKGYLLDTSLLAHLLQKTPETIQRQDPHLFGHLLENFVASELLKQQASAGIRTQLLHFRTSDGKEVDFVLETSDGRFAGVEVKASEVVQSKDFSGLRELQARMPKDFVAGVVLYGGRDTIAFGENLWAMPHAVLWNKSS